MINVRTGIKTHLAEKVNVKLTDMRCQENQRKRKRNRNGNGHEDHKELRLATHNQDPQVPGSFVPV